MVRLLLATFAFSLLMASALHAQVPYTPSPFPSLQPNGREARRQSTLQQMQRQSEFQQQQLWQDIFSVPGTPVYQPRERRRTRPSYQWNFDYNQETSWDRDRRERQQRLDRLHDQRMREFQAENARRVKRCARFGSRKIYADCMDW